jgi:hypothetical protein
MPNEHRLIFISHASADRLIAERLAARFEACDPRLKTFVSSRAGDIGTDSAWLPSAQTALQHSDAYVILLSPNSVLRPWVSFEAGAAWFSGRTCVPVRVGGLTPEEVPLPLSGQQLYDLASPDEARAIFSSLGLNLTAPEVFAGEVAASSSRAGLVGEGEPSWEGLQLAGVWYAWAGPLVALEDKNPIPGPPRLLEALHERGLAVRWASPDRLTQHYAKGRAQVFATDRTQWRRPIVNDGQLLLVARREDPQP